MDMFCRAGSLVPVNATPDISTSTISGGFRGVFLERVPGHMQALFRYYRIRRGDVLIIFKNVGVNALVIDAVEETQRIGAKTIGVAGTPWQEGLARDHPVRHPSGKNLEDHGCVCAEWEGWFRGGFQGVGDTCGSGLADFDRVAAEAREIPGPHFEHPPQAPLRDREGRRHAQVV